MEGKAARERKVSVYSRRRKVEKNGQRLPDEILVKIVEEHLPLRSICRFRSVCKALQTPRLTAAALRSQQLYLSESFGQLYLNDWQSEDEMWKLGCDPDSDSLLRSPCINGLVGLTGDSRIRVSDLCLTDWTTLPAKPCAGKERKLEMFVGMGKKKAGYHRLGKPITAEELDQYVFLYAMASLLYKDLVLQVYSGGKWCSSPAIPFPPGYSPPTHSDSFCVLHGSLFYYLLKSRSCSAMLCCVDVLREDEQPQVSLIKSSPGNDLRIELGALTVVGACSGRVLVVESRRDEKRSGYRMKVEVVEGEELRLLSSSLLPCNPPEHFCFGGDEVHCFTERVWLHPEACYDLRYTLSAKRWEKVAWRRHDDTLRGMCCIVE